MTTPSEYEEVNHPDHYQLPGGIEVIDLVEHLSFNIGNALKYLLRAGKKPQSSTVTDLKKALWYVGREIERIEAFDRRFGPPAAPFRIDNRLRDAEEIQPDPEPSADFIGYHEPPPVRMSLPSDGQTEELRPIIHSHGPTPCRKPAFYLTRRFYEDEAASLDMIRLLPDMRQARPIDPPLCGSCGEAIDPYTTQDLDWAPHRMLRPRPPSLDDFLNPAPSRSTPVPAAAPDPLPVTGLVMGGEDGFAEDDGSYPPESPAPASISAEELAALPHPNAELEAVMALAEHLELSPGGTYDSSGYQPTYTGVE